jgi:UDP-N-acetylmuramoyl-L-alanyl-D-glutamate--2,6-diaminopimelate ligase
MQLIKSLNKFKIYSDAADTSMPSEGWSKKTPLGINAKQSRTIDFEVKGISCDSKQVSGDFIFIAIKGVNADGNNFIQEAIEKGAKAVIKSPDDHVPASPKNIVFIEVADERIALARLAAEFYGNPSSKMRVVGITGTNGKTTTAYLIERVLKEGNFIPAVIGTINYRFKDKLIPSKNTTPGPIELQSMLADMLKKGVNYSIIEVSSHGLDQNRTDQINFSSAIFTNLTQDHLDYHKTQEKYFQAKAKLFKNLGDTAFAVINNDDAYARRLKSLSRGRLISYGIENKADITAKDIKLDLAHTEFNLAAGDFKTNLDIKLIGRHNVYNVLACFAWAVGEGLDLETVKLALEKFNSVPGRLEKINSNAGFSVFVDYAHTEDALKNVISALRQISKNRIIVVFGCGGNRDKTKRPKMGSVVSKLADYAIITNDNPRCEAPEEIIEDIKKGIEGDNYCVILERFEAIKKSLSLAKSGDIVLLAGKGHENYQIFKDKIMHFDDCEVARQCLKSMNY